MRVILFALLLLSSVQLLAQSKSTKPDLSGKHKLTLQWISQTQPGSVMFRKTAKDTYAIEGEQTGKDGCDSCELRITGTVVCKDAKTLAFTGRVETRVFHNNDGQPCVTEGETTFYAKDKRQYWRLQKMQRCSTETDYVDIYFK